MQRLDQWWRYAFGDQADTTPTRHALAGRILSEARKLEEQTLDRAQMIVDAYCLYGDFGAWGVNNALTVYEVPTRRNVIATGVDTVVSELLQTPPRAMWVSRGGTWFDKRTAKKLTSWGDDIDDEQCLDDLRPQFYRDGIIAGTGWMWPQRHDDAMVTTRVFPCNALLDDTTGSDSKPMVMAVRSFEDREVLLSKAQGYDGYSKAIEQAIIGAPNASGSIWAMGDLDGVHDGSDMVEVWTIWRLASKPGEEDGVRAVAIHGATLDVQKYDRTEYELVSFRPIKPTRGYWGISLVTRAGPMQVALNDGMESVDDAMEHHRHGFMVGPPGSDTFRSQWNSEAGNFITHPHPQLLNWIAPEPMPRQFFDWLQQLKAGILEEFAVNEMQAQGTKPTGLDSGVALRTFVDTGSRRYIDMKRASELSHADYMDRAVCVQRDIVKRHPAQKVIYKRHGVPVEIAWGELDPNDRHHRIKTFPASALPNDPAGRIQSLQELNSAGKIDDETFWATAGDVPDFETVRDEVTAPIDFVRFQLDTMLDDGEYVAPWPNSPLERGLKICNAVIHKEAMEGAPEERLDLLRDWMGEAGKYLEDAQAAMAPPANDPMMMGAMPPDPMAMGGGPMGPVPPMDPMLPPGMGPVDPLTAPTGPMGVPMVPPPMPMAAGM